MEYQQTNIHLPLNMCAEEKIHMCIHTYIVFKNLTLIETRNKVCAPVVLILRPWFLLVFCSTVLPQSIHSTGTDKRVRANSKNNCVSRSGSDGSYYFLHFYRLKH